MDADLETLAQRYALRRNINLRERLGFGIHGTVFAAQDNTKPGFFAVKFHREERPFERECRVYQRLREEQITRILGLNVPQLLRIDDHFRAIEMTIVRPPFLLDFADARLDEPPEFSEDVLRLWEEDKAEIFGDKWPEVTRILAALHALDIYLLDINPGNISFPEETR
jgi:serine/threonine protein kinase